MKTVDELVEMALQDKLEGVFTDIPDETYNHVHMPGVRSSFLKTVIKKTPAHAVLESEKQEDTASLLLGRAVHCATFQPVVFAETHTFVPEGMRRDKRSKEYQAFLDANPGKVVLSYEENKEVIALRNKLTQHPFMVRKLPGSIFESTFFHRDPETGILCRVRLDAFTENHEILDLKTSKDPIDPETFERTIYRYGYHISGAMYVWVVSSVLGVSWDRVPFYLVAVEKETGLIAPYRLNGAALEKGMELVRLGLNKIKECNDAGVWPAYHDEPMELGLPAYAWA